MKKFLNLILVLVSCFVIISAVDTAYNLIMHIIYPIRYYEYIDKYSDEYLLDEYLVMGIIKAESNYIFDARSDYATGLMQLTDDTAGWVAEKLNIDFSEDALEDPETNIRMGCYYLNYLIKHYNNTDVALAAYNAGMGNVAKWLKDSRYSDDGKTLSDIPFDETRDYVEKVNKYQETYHELYELNKSQKK